MTEMFGAPKYARIVVEVQRRIESGEYVPGSALPSEALLAREFAVGRTTAVRALQMLQQGGWITREHGRGSFVRGWREGRVQASRPVLEALDRVESSARGNLVAAGEDVASAAAARVLGVGVGERLVRRRWVGAGGESAAELVTWWFPVALARGSDLGLGALLPVGVRDHLRVVKGLRVDRVSERVTARLPSEVEGGLLRIAGGDPVLAVVAGVCDAAGAVRFAVEVVMPGVLRELDSEYGVPK